MTIISLADRVRETSTTTGTGTLDLAGAVSSFQTFVSGVGDGATCSYLIIIGTEWEVGEGTVTDAAPDTLSRDRVLDSSTGGSLVAFSAGTKDVVLSVNAERMAHGGWNTDAQAGTFTADIVNTVYLLNISGASLTANLPAASGNDDLRLGFKVVSHSGSFTATIDGSGAETIDGSATQVLDALNDYLEIICDGTAWHIVDADTHVDVAEGGTTVVSDATRIDFGLGFDVADGGSGEVDVTLDLSEITVSGTFVLTASRDANATNIYLRGPDGSPTNISGFVLPFDATIIGIGAATDGAETWTAQVRKNGSATIIASLAVAAVAKDSTGALSVNVDVDDEIQMFCSGTMIDTPTMTVWFQRR